MLLAFGGSGSPSAHADESASNRRLREVVSAVWSNPVVAVAEESIVSADAYAGMSGVTRRGGGDAVASGPPPQWERRR
jgi:hypothetical protein